MSSTTPSKTAQAAEIRAYHSKIEHMLKTLERDVTTLEVHFRAGPTCSPSYPFPWLSPIEPPSSSSIERIPPGPNLPPPARLTSMEMPVSKPMYTESMIMMSSIYNPPFHMQSEEYKQQVRESRKNLFREGGMSMISPDLVNVRDGDEVYDPTHPLIDDSSNASKPYDLERYRHQSIDGGPIREFESELENEIDFDIDIETEHQNMEMEVNEYAGEGEKVHSSESPSRVSIETSGEEAKDQQRDTIEENSPVNPTSEKFWGQLFGKERQPNNMDSKSISQHAQKSRGHLNSQDDNIETLSNQAFSPFERSPAPGIPSPMTDGLAEAESDSELYQEQIELNNSASQEIGGFQEIEELTYPIGLDELDSEEQKNRYNDLFEDSGMQDDLYPQLDDGNVFWDGGSVPTDFEREAAMQNMEDEYAVMQDEDGFEEEEDDFMDSE